MQGDFEDVKFSHLFCLYISFSIKIHIFIEHAVKKNANKHCLLQLFVSVNELGTGLGIV